MGGRCALRRCGICGYGHNEDSASAGWGYGTALRDGAYNYITRVALDPHDHLGDYVTSSRGPTAE